MIMNETKLLDLSHIHFRSTVFPTEDDLVLWNSLSKKEQMTLIERGEEDAFKSGTAPKVTQEEILARARTVKTCIKSAL